VNCFRAAGFRNRFPRPPFWLHRGHEAALSSARRAAASSQPIVTVTWAMAMLASGMAVLLVAWLPAAIGKLPLSLPIVCVSLGMAVAAWTGVSDPLPLAFPVVNERLSEVLVVITLMACGLKLDRPLGWRRWLPTWRLLGLAMPLTIMGIALACSWLAALPWPVGLLVGAVLAPTDPVLAADVQVGGPHRGREDEVRFTLTAEAGLNDGLAFPFVALAMFAARLDGAAPDLEALTTLALGIAWRLVAGAGAGWLCGRALGWLMFHVPHDTRLAHSGDGLVALGSALAVYGATEVVGGYGFIAVFVAGLMIRAAEREHIFHATMHDFIEQLERLLLLPLLIVFGAALPALIGQLDLAHLLIVLLCLAVIRPAAAMLSLHGSGVPMRQRAVIAAFGIRGMGSVYYLAYALNRQGIAEAPVLWALVALAIGLSVFLHGVTATPVMRHLDDAPSR
jgi:NhaP-type Na+/H+ or K+/H+ antiporter